MLEVRFYDKIEDSQLDFAVIIARTGENGYFANTKKGIPTKCLEDTEKQERPLKKRQEEGTFDNVAACRYAILSYDIGNRDSFTMEEYSVVNLFAL